MTGLTDYTAKNMLNYVSGQIPEPTLPSVWLALFTAVGSDAGTGFTEVAGNGYARVQVAGSIAATAAFTTASPNITMGANPGWVQPGMTVYDTTNSQAIGTVLTYAGTALVLTANAAHASSGSTDNLSFSAFGNATGSAPSSIVSSAAVTFPAATSTGWGTSLAFGLYDASAAGDLLAWDYLGAFAWLPATVSSASPGVITAHAHGYSVADPVIWTEEYGGVAPTFGASNFTGVLLLAHSATDTFDVTNGGTAVNTTSTGNGMVRKIVQQAIAGGVTASFASGSLTVTSA